MEGKIQHYEVAVNTPVQQVQAGERFAIVGEGFGTTGDCYWMDCVLQVTSWSDTRIEAIAPHIGRTASAVVYIHHQDQTRMSPTLISAGPPLQIEFPDAAAPEQPRIILDVAVENDGPHKIVTLAVFDHLKQAIPHATCSLMLAGICINVLKTNERGLMQWVLQREATGTVVLKLTTPDGRRAETTFDLS